MRLNIPGANKKKRWPMPRRCSACSASDGAASPPPWPSGVCVITSYSIHYTKLYEKMIFCLSSNLRFSQLLQVRIRLPGRLLAICFYIDWFRAAALAWLIWGSCKWEMSRVSFVSGNTYILVLSCLEQLVSLPVECIRADLVWCGNCFKHFHTNRCSYNFV